MKRTLVALALSTSVLAAPAMARDGAPYIGIEGGVLLPDDTKFDFDSVEDGVAVTADTGFDVGGVLGYDFGGFRLEGDFSYKQADLGEVVLDGAIDPTDLGLTGLNTPIDGRMETFAAMLNGIIDFGSDGAIQPYVGGGIGWANVSLDATAPYLVEAEDSALAWQAIAGIRVPLSDSIDFGVKYRYFNVPNLEFESLAGDYVETDISSHSVLGTLTVNFGGRSEPAAPPPPPAPVCNKGPYIVFFDWDKADITPEAATTLDSAISAYGNCARVPIMLAGYADRSGGTQYNVGLSARRNTAVTSYLTGKGIPAATISSEAFGEANPRVPTADGVRELQNRRVEITYGPGSGN